MRSEAGPDRPGAVGPRPACLGEPLPGSRLGEGGGAPGAPRGITGRQLLLGVLAAAAWGVLYLELEPAVRFLLHALLDFHGNNRLESAAFFFLYEAPKVLLLLVLVVFGVGILRSWFTPERTRKILAGRGHSAENVIAALLGVATPFCSCSAVPVFLGFVAAGVPLGVTFSFLVAAPMVNEVALVLLLELLGWKVAAIYLGAGLLVAVVSGWTIGRLRLERFVEPWVLASSLPLGEEEGHRVPFGDRIRFAARSVREIVGKVWPWVVLGIAVGAGIHGYVPENFLAALLGEGNWWSVPFAVLLGIPMYSNAAAILPVVTALLEKGAALGTALAFMMSVIALSLPEFVILRKVLRLPLLAAFALVVGTGILLVGFLFNALL